MANDELSWMTSRRRFLKSAAGMAAVGAKMAAGAENGPILAYVGKL